jgi:hypothetical protein
MLILFSNRHFIHEDTGKMSYDYDDDDGDGQYDDGPEEYGGGSPSSGLSPCGICGRNFNPTVLVWPGRRVKCHPHIIKARHQNACLKSQEKAKKRGVFDASKKRIQVNPLLPDPAICFTFLIWRRSISTNYFSPHLCYSHCAGHGSEPEGRGGGNGEERQGA